MKLPNLINPELWLKVENNTVCCELKSKNPTPIQYETQLINAQLFVD
ncbi:MAG: hypothetical protein ABFS56_09775 [Pseudomonadota bacterium]